MMTLKTLHLAVSTTLLTLGLSAVSTMAVAAPASNARTLPVQEVPTINQSSAQIWGNNSASTVTNTPRQMPHGLNGGVNIEIERSIELPNGDVIIDEIDASNTDASDTQTDQNIIDIDVVDETQNNEAQTSTPTANETLNHDLQDEITDDIESGQAVASTPNTTDQSSIDSIENTPTVTKNGKGYTTLNLSNYAKRVNESQWSPKMKVNSAMTVKLQALLDWNHASPGPIDGGWGMNSKKALKNFQAMHNIEQTGKMNQQTWDALIKNIDKDQPVLVEYTLTPEDVRTNFATTPAGAEAKSKMKGLYYQNLIEMLGERFHMDVRYLEKLNKGKSFKAGETITVINVGKPLNERITRVIANKADKTLYAYNGNRLVATYPTTVGSDSTPSPHGTFKIVNKVKMPWYKATVGDGDNKKVYMLPPGPNNPVGVVWMGLSKPSYGLHGSPKPEGISRQASHGCIRLTNWDVLEVYANINKGATVELK